MRFFILFFSWVIFFGWDLAHNNGEVTAGLGTKVAHVAYRFGVL